MASTKRDYYEILGVTRTASGEEIKRAYRRQAMKYHPDRADGDKAVAELKFKECAEAYEVLSDTSRRARYDQYGHQGVAGTGQHDFSHMDVTDIFSMFDDIFGGLGGLGGRAGARNRPQRGFDLETQVELTLAPEKNRHGRPVDPVHQGLQQLGRLSSQELGDAPDRIAARLHSQCCPRSQPRRQCAAPAPPDTSSWCRHRTGQCSRYEWDRPPAG